MSASVVPAVYEDALFHVHAMECALRAQFLTLIADYGQTETWRLDGARGMEEWVAGRFAMSPYQAREMVRVAEALRSLPKIFEVFSQGHLSWDQLRALTRYATPETDEELAQDAQGLSLSMLERRARRGKTKSAAESRAEAQEDYLLMWRQGERLALKANLGGDLAAVVEKALTRALESEPRPPKGEPMLPFHRSLAHALYQVCASAMASDPDPDRATVVLHMDADLLARDDGVGDLEGFGIGSETARRLCCDARVQEVVEMGGIPVGIGRMSRNVPPALSRLLRDRDVGCRFPGCSRRRWVHAHHILHWVKKGPTDLGNLLLLCSYHHRFVHEGEWVIRGNPMGEVEFVRPDGTVFGGGPPGGLRPELHNLLFGDAAHAAA